MRRLLAAATLGLLAASFTPLAQAHNDHKVTWVGQGGQPPLQEGDEVYATDFLALKLSEEGTIRWSVKILHEATGKESACSGEASPEERDQNAAVFACYWDTSHIGDMSTLEPGQSLSDAAVAPNGTYLISGSIEAVDCGGLRLGFCDPPEKAALHDAPPFRVTVANDITKPSGLTQSFNSENRNIHVAWNKNPEPDATYVLEERINGGAWTKHNRGTATSFDRPGDPGVYEYRVVASRPEVPHKTSDVTSPLEIAPPPPGAPPGDPGTVAPAPGGETPPSTSAPSTPSSSGGTATTSRPRSTTTRPRGTEQSRGLGGSNLFSRPTVRTAPPSTTVTTADDGFEEAITYPTQPPRVVEMPGKERAVERLVTEERPVDVRGVLVSLAGGLAVFIFAMQMVFMARRRPSMATTYEDDWA